MSEDLTGRTLIELDRARAHYLLDVMRRKVGDQVRLFNSENGEWLAKISEAGRKRCQLRVDLQLRPPEEEEGPTLLFAPIKKARLDLLVEKATELGVRKLIPVKTRRSIVDRMNLERLRVISIEAAEQCERLSVPDIQDLQSLEQALSNWPKDQPLYVADETGGGVPLLQALKREPGGRPPSFLVGPEGGFDPLELEWLSETSAVVTVDLGPRILRAETAGMAMLTAWVLRASSS